MFGDERGGDDGQLTARSRRPLVATVGKGDGFALAPAYDHLPDHSRNREGVLAFGSTRYLDSLNTVFDVADRWGADVAEPTLEHIVQALANFRAFATDAGVPKANIDELASDIDRRLDLVIQPPEPMPTPR